MSMRVSVYESCVFISNDGLDSELKGGGNPKFQFGATQTTRRKMTTSDFEILVQIWEPTLLEFQNLWKLIYGFLFLSLDPCISRMKRKSLSRISSCIALQYQMKFLKVAMYILLIEDSA